MPRAISDKEYEARWDAESLAKAEEIKADPSRLTAAQEAARKMAEEQRKNLKAINKVARPSRQGRTAGTRPGTSGTLQHKANVVKPGNGVTRII